MKLLKALIQTLRDPNLLSSRPHHFEGEENRLADIDKLMAWASSALPDAEIGEDKYGQLLIYTGLSCPRGEELTNFYTGD